MYFMSPVYRIYNITVCLFLTNSIQQICYKIAACDNSSKLIKQEYGKSALQWYISRGITN